MMFERFRGIPVEMWMLAISIGACVFFLILAFLLQTVRILAI
jgi:hypothetical protein